MVPLFKVAMSGHAAVEVAKVLQSGYVGQGDAVASFEQQLSSQAGLPKTVLSTSSCTDALSLALRCCRVNPGDYVVSTPVTCLATNAAILATGARIVWADVDKDTGNMTPWSAHAALRRCPETPKAIVAVDWGGQLCDYRELMQLGVPVIEDAAHAFGAKREADEWPDYVAYSFGPIKHLCCVDGGALVVPKYEYERAKLLRWFGLDRENSADYRCKQVVREVGMKWHMNDVNATIGLANLRLALENVEKCRENARWFDENIGWTKKSRMACWFDKPQYDERGAWWLYTLRITDSSLWIARDEAIRQLAEMGVAASPVHARNDKNPELYGYLAELTDLPGVGKFTSRNICIPCGWWVGEDEREKIKHAVESVKS